MSGIGNLYRADSIATATGAGAIATALARAIGLVRGIVLAWFLTPVQFGLLCVALLIVNVLVPACTLGLYEAATRYAPQHEVAGTLRSLVVRLSVILAIVVLATAGSLTLLADSVADLLFSTARTVTSQDLTSTPINPATDFGDAAGLLRVSLLCVASLAVFQVMVSLLKGLRMFRVVAAADLFATLAFAVLAIGAVLLGHVSANVVLLCYAASCALATVLFGPGLIRYVWSRDRTESGAPAGSSGVLLRFGVWAAGTAVLWQALSSYPVWYLLKTCDAATVGAFQAARLVTQPVQFAAVGLTAIIAAAVTRSWVRDGRERALPKLTAMTKALILVLMASATLLSLLRPVIQRLFPDSLQTNNDVFNALLLFFLLVGTVGLVATRFYLVERPRCACLAWLVGAAVNVVACYLLFPSADVGIGAANETLTVLSTTSLNVAAWSGVLGVAAALASSAWLARREGLGLDRSTVLLILASTSIAFGWIMSLPVLVCLLAISAGTSLVLSGSEKALLRIKVLASQDRRE